jgi:hypothetical protein
LIEPIRKEIRGNSEKKFIIFSSVLYNLQCNIIKAFSTTEKSTTSEKRSNSRYAILPDITYPNYVVKSTANTLLIFLKLYNTLMLVFFSLPGFHLENTILYLVGRSP